MDKIVTAADLIRGNSYPGRGIVVGLSEDGEKALIAYFIMGRSENSRNRILALEGDTLRTRPFDESKVKDPSLIIYNARRRVEDKLILTNGDQTDTAADAILAGGDFFSSLRTREFEPDAPNYTPRISAFIDFGAKAILMSILRRSAAGECERGEYEYPFTAGEGRMMHTYESDGSPLPSFVGAPRKVAVCGSLDDFAASLWDALDAENKISLFVRSVDRFSGETETRLFNKNAR